MLWVGRGGRLEVLAPLKQLGQVVGRGWKFQVKHSCDIRMARGVDESAIESMAEAADPVILSRSSSGQFVELKNRQILV